MKKMKSQTNEFKIDTNKPHPRLDAIKSKINKLLGATVANYIPIACDELRADWFPTMDDETLKANPAVQEAMKEEIYNLFAKERIHDGVWKESAIENWLRPWLRDVDRQEWTKNSIRKATEVRLEKIRNKYLAKLEDEKRVMDRLVNRLPEPVKEEEEEPEVTTGGWSTGPSKYQKLGEETKSSLTKMGDVRDACRELWTALTDKEHMPHLDEDLIVNHIKPTREYRKFIYELDEHEQAGLYNWLVYTDAALHDMLEILEEAKK